MGTKEEEIIHIDYRKIVWPQDITLIAKTANRMGMEKKNIYDVKAKATFGEGLDIIFKYEKPYF